MKRTPRKRLTSAMVALLAAGMTACASDFEGPPPYDLHFEIPRTVDFAPSLAAYQLFDEPMAALEPAEGTHLYELSSELFTDHAHKQRLVRLPEGTTVVVSAEGALQFPEQTVIAKTFYYPADMRDPGGPRRVIETRLLVLAGGRWNVATYLWNAEQTDASLLLDGATTDVSWLDTEGQPASTAYVVPHEGECVTCHQSGGSSTYIGPTLRNLNRKVLRGGAEVNQLEHLAAEGVLEGADWTSAPAIPSYADVGHPLASRARAYLDANCAHCHNPGAWDEAAQTELDLRFEIPVSQTGIGQSTSALERQLQTGRMPYLGTTLLHDEGVRLVLDYLQSL
jgi:uncharacterized repeat protein (TIGR03806 family)